jgi:NADPH2:quinone reductase
MADLASMMKDGRIKPRITATFPLDEGGKALEMIEDRKVTGKVVLTCA